MPVPETERAVQLAYRALSSRDRTVAELRTWLERKRVAPEAIEQAVSELSAAGFLDDLRFAQRYAEDKRSLDRWGAERIRRDLLRRGVPAGTVERAEGGREREDELAAALQLLGERVAPPADDRERDKAWQLLIRKGYEPDLAYDAVRAHGARRAA
jgi:regulatory protein